MNIEKCDISNLSIDECIRLREKYEKFYKTYLEKEFNNITGKTLEEVDELNLTCDGYNLHNGNDFENIVSNIAIAYNNKYIEHNMICNQLIKRINSCR